jgi:hypothetical protein
MRKLYTIFFVVVLTSSLSAQAPQRMSYQAVIRNNSDVLVSNHAVGMKISILKDATPVYVETQAPASNANGLITIEIGSGTPVTGTFATIDWSSGTYFIKTETDPTGGTTYSITGTSQLLSVPYAFYAKTAGGHYIGENYGGGIVFYVNDNGQHGLIAATADQSTGIKWYNGINRYTGTTGDGLYAGSMNTAMIVATQMADNQTGNFAAKDCADYSVTVGGLTYGDWYIPSKYELNLLYLQKIMVGGFSSAEYWSSTEGSDDGAWVQVFSNGSQYNGSKFGAYYVRAIRAF